MSKKIIAISATHGTGKTTQVYNIAAFLKKQGKKVVVLNELARECPFAINKDGEDRTQVWLITEQIVRELQLMDRYDYVIADRSLFDSYAYASYLCKKDWIFKDLWDYIVAHVNKYYIQTYLLNPVTFNYNFFDGIRDNDEIFRNLIHEKLKDVLSKSGARYKIVNTEEELYKDFS